MPAPPTPPPPPGDINRFITLAEACADAAGEVLTRYFRQSITVETKADASPVTIADREAETAMRALIGAAFPDHGIIGEELPNTNTDAPFTWVLDPIDGTKSFITGKPSFGTLVSLAQDGVPILGLINQPITQERWLGAIGRESTLNGAPARTRNCAALGDAMLYTTSPYLFPGDTEAGFQALRAGVRHALYGGDCYSYGLLASGFADIVVEAGLKPYDYAALVPVVEGAGGVITGWDGEALTLASDGRVLAASTKTLHDEALSILQSN
ncbi:MAG: inositol-phosphate phosphatase/L-galactose 1-phosphate phosphatase/histidinol-phosphatase [Alphaproteobacteria bacterium]|jgi:inositol-phosphate phosphatase/L-galactose 1-phosphate phosphatase/histidinol-phosphatase